MRLLLLQRTTDPAALAETVAGQLGEGWEVTVAETARESPDALASSDVVMAGATEVRAAHIAAAPSLKLIQTPTHGFDHIDADAAAQRSIPVCTVAGSGAEAGTVAEHAFMLMLVCAKRYLLGHEGLLAGRWTQGELVRAGIGELCGKTLGIVGVGHIGREVAKRAWAFDMAVQYHDVVAAPDVEERYNARRLELDELLRTSQFISIHVPLLESTRGLIGARELALLPDGAVLVNTARGPVVDNVALAEACGAGRIWAGIDVFDPEPPPPDHPLLTCGNVALSAHVAGVNRESLARMREAALANIRRFAAGEPLDDVVNGVHAAG